MEKELNKANERLDTLKQSIAKKENELKQIEAEIVSALLTENNLSFSELTALLSEKNQVVKQVFIGNKTTYRYELLHSKILKARRSTQPLHLFVM